MIKESFHANLDTLPWAEGWSGDARIRLQLLMSDIEGQRFAVRMQFAPGLEAAPHKHTGEVHAITLSGSWTYLEYPDSPYNMAGSYLFEPPGTTHTLKIHDDNEGTTDVIFIIYGAMLHLDAAGAVIGITDAESVISEYAASVGSADIKVPLGAFMSYVNLKDFDLAKLINGD